MRLPILLQAISLLGLGSSINAHHMLTNVFIGGVNQGDGVAVRVPPSTNPVVDMQSTDMVCNVGGLKSLLKAVIINAGDPITFQWRPWPDGSQNPPIADSHQGPCAVYMKRVDSFKDAPNGPGWFKIWHDGFRNGESCTERLRASEGRMTATIPKDLAGGLYMIRTEHLALHQAQDIGGAQWYIGCVQAIVYSTGGNAHPAGVSIPGYCDAKHPGVHFDYWKNTKPTSYTIPGPAPYVVTNAGGGRRVAQEFNHKNPNCPVSNADWCSTTLPAYTNEASCWQSSGSCWDQVTTCYDTAPATGHKGCTDFERYCTSTQDQCRECARGVCRGTFPPPQKRSISSSSDGGEALQEGSVYKRVRRTAASAPVTVHLDKKEMASQICDLIYDNCNKKGVLETCRLFKRACTNAAIKGTTEQFPDKAERKWQALWLYEFVCDHEGLDKDACRERFLKVLEGFE